jgi:uncharacterized membrane protein
MKYLYILFPLAAILFNSCSSADNAESTASETDTAAVTQFRGLYSTGKFISCDNPRIVYTVNDQTHLLDSVYKRTLPQAYPKQTMYIEFRGSIPENSNKDIIVVDDVTRSEAKSIENDCLPFDYWCKGNEPFWQAHISETENLIDVFLPLLQESHHFEFVAPAEESGKTVYTAINEKDNVRITITSEFCNDGMSERRYNFKAVVELNGVTYQGCAVTFNEPH